MVPAGVPRINAPAQVADTARLDGHKVPHEYAGRLETTWRRGSIEQAPHNSRDGGAPLKLAVRQGA